jgi:hypothetical protein
MQPTIHLEGKAGYGRGKCEREKRLEILKTKVSGSGGKGERWEAMKKKKRRTATNLTS